MLLYNVLVSFDSHCSLTIVTDISDMTLRFVLVINDDSCEAHQEKDFESL